MWHEICDKPILSDDKIEKSAKEMFEELGYKKTNSEIEMIIYNNSENELLYFYLDTKDVNVDNITFINIELLKAINQQCKELGWL